MANTATKAVKDERVELYIPRGPQNEEKTELISINGKNWVLPKGKTSLVPPCVKAEYDRAVKAQEYFDRRVSDMVDAAAEPDPGQ